MRIVTGIVLLLGQLALCDERPNVLFIAVDDLNDWVNCMGGRKGVHTPNFDRLAKRGVLFTNAHCAAPACNPSRGQGLHREGQSGLGRINHHR